MIIYFIITVKMLDLNHQKIYDLISLEQEQTTQEHLSINFN